MPVLQAPRECAVRCNSFTNSVTTTEVQQRRRKNPDTIHTGTTDAGHPFGRRLSMFSRLPSGLSVIEMTESVEMRYVNGESIRESRSTCLPRTGATSTAHGRQLEICRPVACDWSFITVPQRFLVGQVSGDQSSDSDAGHSSDRDVHRAGSRTMIEKCGSGSARRKSGGWSDLQRNVVD